jgi:uncharacterized protein (DUF433 family)
MAATQHQTTVEPGQIVAREPGVHHGAPVFVGTRVPVWTLVDYPEGGETLDAFLEQYPSVSRDVAVAALELLRDRPVNAAG